VDRDREVEVRREEHRPGAIRREETEVRREDTETSRDDPVVQRDPNTGIAAARDRFGGIDIPATLIGMLVAIALLVILGGIAAGAVSAFGYQTGIEEGRTEDVTVGGMIAGIVVLLLSFLVGGWTAGRMARYDGVKNGVMVVVWTIILVAILSALAAAAGDEYNVLARAELPRFDRDVVATGAIVSALVALAAMLVGSVLGGIWGAMYHKRADREILAPRAT
jgi:MFS family permease